ncbi:flagellar motor switch protein FliM [Sphingomonas sp. AP4-R1]|uniref:flagellar motor switch protein FliM n=1 Tax=Sphingomonas sp. AP4-R1 TaxID=2735134 RepID=UPI001493911C|nr:flagellar motor switch protein FliM [Sphingomonas sp. AP4-R1]QJU57445.1 flagellar motor switch protein FliM [Sphingomonas sp. AP4-R1]
MIDDMDASGPDLPGFSLGSGDTFDQAGIDAIFGFSSQESPQVRKGLRALLDANVISHERLPMLEVVCERMVRTFATSMRNLTSDAIDVHMEEVTSTRFGDFMNRLPLPAMIGVFHVKEWDNYGVVTVNSSLIYAVVDALLGGRKGNGAVRIDGRAFTAIETMLVSKMIQLALDDFSASFEAIEPVTMKLERVEASPRFAAIAGPSNLTAVATFRVDMEGRGGKFNVLLPYATIEPVRDKLLQRFVGEKLGRDRMWEMHMESEIRQTEICLDVVLGETAVRVQDYVALKVGQTISLHTSPDDPLEVTCGGVTLGTAQIGRRSGRVAIQMLNDIGKGASQ